MIRLLFFQTNPELRSFFVCIVICLLLSGVGPAKSQQDTLSVDAQGSPQDTAKVHSPKKASVYSAILPGLGQVYNKKYWKVPIVYAGFGALIWAVDYNAGKYKKYKDAYRALTDQDPDNDDVFGLGYPVPVKRVEVYKDYYRRNRDLSIIATAGFYILQIIDATVDAHLFDYDISDELTLRLEPAVIPGPFAQGVPGLQCCVSVSF